MPAARARKCTGASTCVPVCTPHESFDTLAGSPRAISIVRWIEIGGLSGQCTMPFWMGIETSIHAPLSLTLDHGSTKGALAHVLSREQGQTPHLDEHRL